jgi:Cys-tRNA(Pro)/Cys-tRNA(Cys) deacylase
MSAITHILRNRGVPFRAIHHAKTFTAMEEAEALGLDPADVLKSVVLDTGEGHAVAVVPSNRRLDMHLVGAAVGDRHAHLATEEELREDFPGVELGAFPPIAEGVPTYVDPEIFAADEVVFAAGRQSESIRVSPTALFRQEPVIVTPLTRDGEEA